MINAKTNHIYVKFDCGQSNLFITPNFYVFITVEKLDNSIRIPKITFLILSLITETAGGNNRMFCSQYRTCLVVS